MIRLLSVTAFVFFVAAAAVGPAEVVHDTCKMWTVRGANGTYYECTGSCHATPGGDCDQVTDSGGNSICTCGGGIENTDVCSGYIGFAANVFCHSSFDCGLPEKCLKNTEVLDPYDPDLPADQQPRKPTCICRNP